MKRLAGKVALITGGNSGIGLASAKLFAAEGAHVLLVGRRADAVEAAARDVGPACTGFVADVAQLASLERLYADIANRFDRLDVVFANAGIMRRAPFGTVTPEQFDHEIAVNVRGTFFTVQMALPLLRDGGAVILTASISHLKGLPADHLYAGAKAAVRAFARGWTTDLRGRNIRVNVLSPGPTMTPIATKMGIPMDVLQQQLLPALVAQIPLGRIADADEIAKAALFLACDDSSFMTGADLCVDGGMAQI
ncbi:MAG TPA: SDR family oxidoreductase [Kofleriaceae bacterium]|nr:SDR family oxidoreductase [Kofleriaceae bacterium]